MDANSRLVIEGALILTDATSNAAFAGHVRALHVHQRTVGALHLDRFQPDGLVGHGAHLLAHDAILIIGPGNAAILVDVCQADDLLPLLFQL